MSCGLHDAMQFEARGIQVAMLVTDAFRQSVAEQLEAIAFTAFAPIYVPHPVAGLPVEEVRRKADAAVPELLARLTGEVVSGAEVAECTADALGEVGCEVCTIEAAERGL